MAGVGEATWNMMIQTRDLVEAIGTARRRATLRGKAFELEKEVIFAASQDAAMDIPGAGIWASPIATNGATIRRLAPALSGPEIQLSYCEGGSSR
jgi:hypothetical protein